MNLSLTLRNHTSGVGRLVDRIDAFGAEAGLPPDVTFRLALSLDEIVSNVIRHGLDDNGGASNPGDARRRRRPSHRDGRRRRPRRSTRGALPFPTSTRRSKSVKAGGLGMHLVRETMDEIDYRRENGRNVLTVRTSVARRDTPAAQLTRTCACYGSRENGPASISSYVPGSRMTAAGSDIGRHRQVACRPVSSARATRGSAPTVAATPISTVSR